MEERLLCIRSDTYGLFWRLGRVLLSLATVRSSAKLNFVFILDTPVDLSTMFRATCTHIDKYTSFNIPDLRAWWCDDPSEMTGNAPDLQRSITRVSTARGHVRASCRMDLAIDS